MLICFLKQRFTDSIEDMYGWLSLWGGKLEDCDTIDGKEFVFHSWNSIHMSNMAFWWHKCHMCSHCLWDGYKMWKPPKPKQYKWFVLLRLHAHVQVSCRSVWKGFSTLSGNHSIACWYWQLRVPRSLIFKSRP